MNMLGSSLGKGTCQTTKKLRSFRELEAPGTPEPPGISGLFSVDSVSPAKEKKSYKICEFFFIFLKSSNHHQNVQVRRGFVSDALLLCSSAIMLIKNHYSIFCAENQYTRSEKLVLWKCATITFLIFQFSFYYVFRVIKSIFNPKETLQYYN